MLMLVTDNQPRRRFGLRLNRGPVVVYHSIIVHFDVHWRTRCRMLAARTTRGANDD